MHTPRRSENEAALLPLGQQWTRELRMSVEDGCYRLHDTFSDTEILGWMIQTGTFLTVSRIDIHPFRQTRF
jgi:hypothetical protein